MNERESPQIILCIAINTTSAGTLNVTRNLYAEFAARRDGAGGIRLLLVVPDIAEFRDFASSAAIEIIRIPLGTGILRVIRRCLFEFVWIRQAVRRWRPAGVLILGNYSLVRLGVRKAVMFRHPYLVDREATRRLGFGARRLQEFLRRIAFRRTLQTTRRIIVQSDAMRGLLLAAFPIEPSRVHVVANPVPPFFLDERSRAPAARGARRPVLLYPSRYNEHKNHALILDLANRHRRRLTELGLKFSVTLKSEPRVLPLLRRIEHEGLGGLIVNLGELPQSSLAAVYRESLALFFPSNSETYPNALPESMCFGLPIIVNDRPWARVICGDAALYFDGDQPDSAMAAIERLLEDWDGWSRRAHQSASVLFPAGDWADRMIGICLQPA